MIARSSCVWIGSLLLALGVGAGPASADATGCAPKVDNFVLFVDQSGSMYQSHDEAGEIKAVLAKRVLDNMNAIIPEVDYRGSLYLFAPFETVLAPAGYWRRNMSGAISRIPDAQPIAIRTTPMADGFESLKPVVDAMSGKTAVIMFSDGNDNGGVDPIEAARALQTTHPELCVHVVSLADTDHGRQVNQQISKVGQACQYVEGPALLASGSKMQQFVNDVFCAPPAPAVKRKLVLRGVHFDFDKATIRDDGRPVLDEAIRALQAEPDVRVEIDGYTDAVGSEAYNMQLSRRRAHAVAEYLVAGGVARSRLSEQGFGETHPVASNENADGRAQNRRVEFRIIGQ